MHTVQLVSLQSKQLYILRTGHLVMQVPESTRENPETQAEQVETVAQVAQ